MRRQQVDEDLKKDLRSNMEINCRRRRCLSSAILLTGFIQYPSHRPETQASPESSGRLESKVFVWGLG
ncbi:hypothetical protein H9L39_07152 [Fusarium oxysporum f. sp. albedinis]|nr:hypothetical protein H9L39_07152 [Fusarium oxysporum f. sp. albedinis]